MKKLVILLPIILLLFSLKIYAVGISSPYLVNNTIKLMEGKSTIYTINLQNTEDIDIDVSITYSSEIAKIIDYKERYTLPAKKLDTKISFNITAPIDAKIGDTYTISYSMKSLGSSGDGLLPMTTGMSKKFNVEIIKDPDSPDTNFLLYFFVSVIAVLILIIIWKKIKKKNF